MGKRVDSAGQVGGFAGSDRSGETEGAIAGPSLYQGEWDWVLRGFTQEYSSCSLRMHTTSFFSMACSGTLGVVGRPRECISFRKLELTSSFGRLEPSGRDE